MINFVVTHTSVNTSGIAVSIFWGIRIVSKCVLSGINVFLESTVLTPRNFVSNHLSGNMQSTSLHSNCRTNIFLGKKYSLKTHIGSAITSSYSIIQMFIVSNTSIQNYTCFSKFVYQYCRMVLCVLILLFTRSYSCSLM